MFANPNPKCEAFDQRFTKSKSLTLTLTLRMGRKICQVQSVWTCCDDCARCMDLINLRVVWDWGWGERKVLRMAVLGGF